MLCIHFLILGDQNTKKIPANIAAAPTLPNTPLNFSNASTAFRSPPSVSLAINLPSKCANEEERNQNPITKPTISFGASFVTNDNPTGDRHSSPRVCKRYARSKK